MCNVCKHTDTTRLCEAVKMRWERNDADEPNNNNNVNVFVFFPEIKMKKMTSRDFCFPFFCVKKHYFSCAFFLFHSPYLLSVVDVCWSFSFVCLPSIQLGVLRFTQLHSTSLCVFFLSHSSLYICFFRLYSFMYLLVWFTTNSCTFMS